MADDAHSQATHLTVGGKQKGVFRLVYLLLTFYTLWVLTQLSLGEIISLTGDSVLGAAFNGASNLGTLKVVLAFSSLAFSAYMFVLYLAFELYEEEIVSPSPTGGQLSEDSGLIRASDFFLRFSLIASIVFIPKLYDLTSLGRAWLMITALSGLFCLWQLLVSRRDKDRDWRLIILPFALTVVAFSLAYVSDSTRQTEWALASVLGALAVSMLIAWVIFHQLVTLKLGAKLKVSVVRWFGTW